jgi:hypothetical protein
MVADITQHVDKREVAVRVPPLTIDAFEPVMVAAGDDRLKWKVIGSLSKAAPTRSPESRHSA